MVEKTQEKAAKPEEEVNLSIDMDKEELLAAAQKLKKDKSKADKKIIKLEQRFLTVVKERNAIQS